MILLDTVTVLDAMLDSSNISEPSSRETALSGWQGEYSSATAYTANQRVMVTGTGGGAATATHGIYIAQGSTTGNDPTTDDGTNWVFEESTDLWKMFDNIPQDQSTLATQIDVDITPGVNYDAIALFNVEASDVTVIIDDPVEGEVHNQNYSLVDNAAIIDYYPYFFEPVKQANAYYIGGLPNYINSTLTVQINSGTTAKVGRLAFGLGALLGTSLYGATIGTRDFSTKTTDANGRVTLTPGNYAATGLIEVWVAAGAEAAVQRKLEDARASANVWVGKDSLSGTIIFGYPQDWKMTYRGPDGSRLLINLQGLS